MENFWIAALGAIQGLSEFLPISSSGHLALGKLIAARFGAGLSFEQPLLLEIVFHFATLLAVVVFYRKSIASVFVGLGRLWAAFPRGAVRDVFRSDDGAKLGVYVAVATPPTGLIGVLLEKTAGDLSQSAVRLGLVFLGCSLMLLATVYWRGGERALTLRSALIIGLVQGIAVLPGLSRSGATIAAGLVLGLRGDEAARFSFLLSIPAVLGATALELNAGELAAEPRLAAYAVGGLLAFAIGLVALKFLVGLLQRGRLWMFAPYVAAVAIAAIFFI